MPEQEDAVLRVADISIADIGPLFAPYGLTFSRVEPGCDIPGTFWGEPEAGLIASTLYYRDDTPVHSVLHEACHFACMPQRRRNSLHTNAGGDNIEENAVCYLQILLADFIEGLGRQRLMDDMDAWGYSFRLGSARRWFEEDAQDAREWLQARKLIPLQCTSRSIAPSSPCDQRSSAR